MCWLIMSVEGVCMCFGPNSWLFIASPVWFYVYSLMSVYFCPFRVFPNISLAAIKWFHEETHSKVTMPCVSECKSFIMWLSSSQLRFVFHLFPWWPAITFSDLWPLINSLSPVYPSVSDKTPHHPHNNLCTIYITAHCRGTQQINKEAKK